LKTTIEEEGLREYARVYKHGFVMDERSGCAIVMDHREVKIKLAGQMSIFTAEAPAIIEAIKITRKCGVDKRIVTLKPKKRGNSKQMVLKNLMVEEGSNLKLMWVPAHEGIRGNETTSW
jgi:hypothetical protein